MLDLGAAAWLHGRFAERPVAVLAVLGKLDDVDQVAAQARETRPRRGGRRPPSCVGRAAAAAPRPTTSDARVTSSQARNKAEQVQLRELQQGVGQHEGLRTSPNELHTPPAPWWSGAKRATTSAALIEPLNHAIGRRRHGLFSPCIFSHIRAAVNPSARRSLRRRATSGVRSHRRDRHTINH